MPIYEYQCEKCGTFETTQRITEKPLSKCPTCKSRVKKLISNTSFQLKGTGWYVTDYARKDKRSPAKTDNGAAKSVSETKKETKTETSSKSGEKSPSTSSSPSAS